MDEQIGIKEDGIDKEITRFIKERRVNLTLEQKYQVLEILRMITSVGKATSAKKLAPIIDVLKTCDPEVAYAVLVLMPTKSIDHMVDCSNDGFKISVNRIMLFIRAKQEKDNIDKTLGEGI